MLNYLILYKIAKKDLKQKINMKIEIPKGYEIDKVTTTEITLKKIEPKLPKSWEELESIDGYWVWNTTDIVSRISVVSKLDTVNKHIFKTKEQAEASIALSQLSQLMAVYNDGWQPDWSEHYENKHLISFCDNVATYDFTKHVSRFLAFKEESIAKLFLENFKDLIYKAKPLL